MGFFRRTSLDQSDAVSPIHAFWSWWASDSHQINPSQPSSGTDRLSDLLRAVHPDLTWHFGPGSSAQHRLTVSAGGVAEVRPWAERWLRAAPAASPLWEFRSSQEADPGATTNVLEIAGERLELASTVFRIVSDKDALRVHVGVHHPGFSALPEQARLQVCFLLMDWLVGEDDVERWIGQIEVLTDAPDDPQRSEQVVAAVSAIAALREPEEWSLARFEDREGNPGMAVFRRGIRWIDFPTLDRHQVITAMYRSQENGLPADAAVLDQLRSVEDDLVARLGHRGLLVAHQTNGGQRVFHVYTDGEDQNADELIRDWARGHGVAVEAAADPAWTQVRAFTG